MCMRCVLAAVLTLTAEPPSPLQPAKEREPQRPEQSDGSDQAAMAQQAKDPFPEMPQRHAKYIATLEGNIERLRQENRNLCAELARVTDLAMKFQDELSTASKFALMLAAKQ